MVGGCGGPGILGAGGSGANSRLTFSSHGGGMSCNAESGQGTAVIEPNRLIFGGGGGGGGTIMATYSSWYVPVGTPGCGGPGAGGGGMGNYSGSTGAYVPSGPGGMLGGGGGASAYIMGGFGGNAGGGGGSGYQYHGYGGEGLVIVQYKVTE